MELNISFGVVAWHRFGIRRDLNTQRLPKRCQATALQKRAPTLGAEREEVMRAVLMLAALATVFAGVVIAQTAEETTRKLWDTAFVKPNANKAKGRRPRTYRIATPKIPGDKARHA